MLPFDFSVLDSTSWTLDPSWRFAADQNDQNGRMLRTLDMLTLTRVDEACFTDTGLFDGPAEDLEDWRLIFRAHPDWGAYSFAELATLAHRPNLAVDFFAGASLPSPRAPHHAPGTDD